MFWLFRDEWLDGYISCILWMLFNKLYIFGQMFIFNNYICFVSKEEDVCYFIIFLREVIIVEKVDSFSVLFSFLFISIKSKMIFLFVNLKDCDFLVQRIFDFFQKILFKQLGSIGSRKVSVVDFSIEFFLVFQEGLEQFVSLVFFFSSCQSFCVQEVLIVFQGLLKFFQKNLFMEDFGVKGVKEKMKEELWYIYFFEYGCGVCMYCIVKMWVLVLKGIFESFWGELWFFFFWGLE